MIQMHDHRLQSVQDTPRQTVLSICIPTYNRAAGVKVAIETALRESDRIVDRIPVEIVVCDNASTDQTKSVVEQFQHSRIRYQRSDTLVSMYANHNRCIDLARGEWITFLHSDDTYPDKYLSGVADLLHMHPEADLLTNLSLANTGFDVSDFATMDPQKRCVYQAASVLLCGGGPPSGSIYRRAAFDRCGRFDETTYMADTKLTVDWLIRGCHAVHFRVDPPVWELRPGAVSVSTDYVRNHWHDWRLPYQAAFGSHLADALREATAELFHRLGYPWKMSVLYTAFSIDQRGLARHWIRRDPARLRYLRSSRFYTHVLPSIISHRAYHALRWRIFGIRQWIRQRNMMKTSPMAT